MQHFDKDGFTVDGARRLMYSGEFHYFRVPKADWRRRLRLWRAAGGNTVATYVPWLIHEPEEGVFRHFDLLRAFLDAVAEEGLDLVVRPGAYQYSELLNDGLPGWLLKDYPQVLARDKQGKPIRSCSVSYQHPLLLEKIENYFAQVCPLLAEYTQSHGGPVVCTQLDNELFGIHCWFGGLDYNQETFGFGREDGRYAQYLRGRFKEVAALNDRYGVRHRRFGDFGLADEPKAGLPAFLWNRDYFDFYTEQGVDYLGTLMGLVRKYGVDTQVCHNSGSPRLDSWFLGANEALGPDFLLGSDHYYCLNQSWAQNNPTPQYFVLMYLSCETLRLMGNPPSVLEFPFGSCSDFPAITAQDMGAAFYLHLAMGMKGLNGYIYTGGPNMPGTGVTTDVYDYVAPVGADGKVRPTYNELKRIGRFLKENPEVTSAEPAVDFQILMPWRAARGNAPFLKPFDLPGALKPLALWETTVRQGLVTSAFVEGLLPQFVKDVANADREKVLVVPCDGTMAAKEQRALLAFVRGGGRVLCLPLLPQYDEDYRPCTILADAPQLSVEGMVDLSRERPRITVGPVANVYCNDGWARATKVPARAEVLGRDEFSGAPVCVKVKAGQGVFAWLGMSWSCTNREQPRMMSWLLESLGMERHLLKDDMMVFCTLRGKYLFLCNLTTTPRQVKVTLRDGREISRRVPAMKVLVETLD